MSAYNWQKSSYSNEGANCLYVAMADDGTIKLRESDMPDKVVTASAGALKALLFGLKIGSFDTLTGNH